MDGIPRRAVVAAGLVATVLVVMEFLDEVPRDVKRAAIVSLTLILVGVILLGKGEK